MSTSSGCDACGHDGARGRSCPHCAIQMFPEQHEDQFFDHDNMLVWLLSDTTLDEPPLPPPPNYVGSFPEPFLPGQGRTFGVPLWASEGIGAGHAATSSDTITPFSESRFTDASTENAKVAGDAMAPNEGGPSVEREAKVMRYKEKKKKRRYDKHIRYALRQAYAEMRPRINGRFAKVPEMSPEPPSQPQPPPPPPPYDPSKPDHGWFGS